MKNKKLANRILLFLFLGFSIITLFRIFIMDNFTVRMLSFTIEAALVGGIADWFAVTALFKEPLGFPWHTAIIPKNRDKVIDSVAVMVENELLSSQFIEGKIKALHIIDLLISYIDNPNTKKSVAKLIEKYAQEISRRFDTGEIAENIESFLKDKLKNTNISVWLKKLADWAIEKGEYEHALETIINGLIIYVKKDSTKNEIYKILNEVVEKRKSETTGFKQLFLELSLDIAQGTNSINIKDAAESLQLELLKILINMKDKNDPIYIKLDQMLKEALQKMETDPVTINSIEKWKEEIIGRIQLKEELERFIKGAIDISVNVPAQIENYSTDIREEFKGEITGQWTQSENHTINGSAQTGNSSKVIQWLMIQVNKYWNNFKEDEKIKNWLEAYIKENLMKVIKAEHHLVGIMVKETLSEFTNEALNEFIESKAGNDLHWIRINGSIVGAVVGIILYLFVNLFYGPVVAPIIRGWVGM
jgi:Predicted membrane protein